MNIKAFTGGILIGRIAMLDINDANPSLAFKVFIPVSFQQVEATLSVDLRHPEVRSWQGLTGRSYLFNKSTERYTKSDGETFILDDVFGDLRTATEWVDTFISQVQFGDEHNGQMDVKIYGNFRMDDDSQSFTASAKLKVEGVILDAEFKDHAIKLLDMKYYKPVNIIDGTMKYEPMF